MTITLQITLVSWYVKIGATGGDFVNVSGLLHLHVDVAGIPSGIQETVHPRALVLCVIHFCLHLRQETL